MHVPGSNELCGHVETVKPSSHQAVVPASRAAQAGKLMLAHQDSGKAVRIHFCLPLVIGDVIELAECLPERLPNGCGENPIAPLLKLRRFRRERMPKADAGGGSNINGFSPSVADLAFAVEAGTLPALLIAENPDQPASQQAK